MSAPPQNWTNQTIWTGDNLDIMRGILRSGFRHRWLHKSIKREILVKILLFTALVFLLAACGGSGGGGGARDLLEQTAFSGSPSSGTVTQQLIASVPAQQVGVISPALAQLLKASGQTAFGSVTQSFGSGLSPVTGVDTSFNGTRFVLNLNRRDGDHHHTGFIPA